MIDLCDFGKLVVRQREVEDVDVVADVIDVLGTGDHHVAHLRVPAEDHLRVALAVLLRELREHVLAHEALVAVTQRVPRHDRRAHRLEVRLERRLRVVGVRLHLHERGLDLGRGDDFFDLVLREVGQAQASDLARLDRPLHRLVRPDVVAHGLVQEQEVDVIGAEPRERFVDCLVRVRVDAGLELRDEVNFLAGNAAALHAAPDRLFVHVGVRRIDHAVAVAQRVVDRLLRLIGLHQKGADAAKRGFRAVVQSDVFHG